MKKTFISFIAFLFILTACSRDEYSLPTPSSGSSSFGANDTNYVELSPVWKAASLGVELNDPHDVTIGLDGMIYVADTGNDRVLAMSRAGEVFSGQGFEQLTGISHPTGVSVDSKLNVLISNESDTVYCWNQYFNFTEIDSIAESALFLDSETNQPVEMTFTDYVDFVASGEPQMQFLKILFKKDNSKIAGVRELYPIYVAETADEQINGVAAGKYGSGLFYITESTLDRISEIVLVPKIAVKTVTGSILFQYSGILSRNIAQYGSGAGTVDDPRAIKVDHDGNIYFTQLGGNFRVQKLNYPDFEPAYVLGVHDIMDLERFQAPMDIDIDDENAIFVVDQGTGIVSKFFNAGRNAGQEAYLGKRGLATTEFVNAKGILATDNIVYVVESGENQIRRYQYSISDDDVPDDNKTP